MDDQQARAALDALIRERREDYAGLSRLLGRNSAYVQQYVKRGTPRRLSEGDRQLLARYFGVAEAVLGGPEAPPLSIARSGRAKRGAALVAVPRLAVSASAGAGVFPEDERPQDELLFASAMLRGLGATRADTLALLRVEGDSMVPTLADGDEMLVDQADAGDRAREGVYVLRLGDALMVKRIVVAPTGALSVLSDNPAGPRWQHVDPAELHIVGRVLWAGGRVR